MLTPEQIQTLHQLYYAEHWPIRKIERHLRVGWRTITRYLQQPDQPGISSAKPSTLDPFKQTIADLLAQDPTVNSAVIEQRLRALGYTGGHSILREHIATVRPKPAPRAFVRMEPIAGERCEVGWGHFGAMDCDGDKRKLYVFALVECHSRMLYLEFTHSQNFETFIRCHINAFQALGAVSREIWYDNLATAVAEHDGRLVRFQPRFFAFAGEFGFVPRACNRAAGWEKGKVERGGVGYVRQRWPRGHKAQQRLLALLEVHCPRTTLEDYLRSLVDSVRALARRITELSHSSLPLWAFSAYSVGNSRYPIDLLLQPHLDSKLGYEYSSHAFDP